MPQGSSARAVVLMQSRKAELERLMRKDAAGKCNEFGCTTYWHGYYWHTSISLEQGKIHGHLRCVSHGPVRAAACVKFAVSINGSSFSLEYLSREYIYTKKNLFPGVAPIRSLAQLQPHMSNGCLDVRFELDVD